MTRLSALLLACSFEPSDYSAHMPVNPDCGRVAIAEYQAEADCVRLSDANGRALFKLSTSESCGGPECILLKPGETGYVLEKVKLGERAEWDVQVGACDELPKCNNEVRP